MPIERALLLGTPSFALSRSLSAFFQLRQQLDSTPRAVGVPKALKSLKTLSEN